MSDEKKLVERIGFIGDIHLCCKKYGNHRDYPKESLEYFHKITEVAEEEHLTMLIGTGDFSYYKFSDLMYRLKVEEELIKQNQITNGRRYEIKGNHDIASSGMTEYEYYTSKGLLKPAENIKVAGVNISMIDNGQIGNTKPMIVNGEVNIITCHDYVKFHDTKLPNFGDAIELDNITDWFGADYVIAGHVHKVMAFEGFISNGVTNHKTNVVYPGCMMRPAYREGALDENGYIIIFDVYDNGEVVFWQKKIELWSLDKSFNLGIIDEVREKKEEKSNRVDISDIVNKLNEHERNVGNPEDIIKQLEDIDDKYKNKAIDLLVRGSNEN